MFIKQQPKLCPFLAFFFIILLVYHPDACSNNAKNGFYFQPIYLYGITVANYSNFPETGPLQGFELNIGTHAVDTSKSLTLFYRYPLYGLGFSYLNPGNLEAFGTEYSLFTYLAFSPFKALNSLKIKTGIGASYFTKIYNDSLNRHNKAIGSHYTWYYQLGAMQDFKISRQLTLSIGFSYLHASNGHVKLPNFGLNKGALTFSARYCLCPEMSGKAQLPNHIKTKQREAFVYFRQGNGYHALGGTTGPLDAERGMVYSGTLAAGILFKNHIRVRSGFTYRYYEVQKGFAKNYEEGVLKWPPARFASNIYFNAGCEFLIGHFGIDIEGGINLFKPFYPYFFEEYEHGGRLSYQLKKIFPSRLGLNYYIISTEKKPVNNFGIGAHINANFGEADFTEVSFSYIRMLNQK